MQCVCEEKCGLTDNIEGFCKNGKRGVSQIVKRKSGSKPNNKGTDKKTVENNGGLWRPLAVDFSNSEKNPTE